MQSGRAVWVSCGKFRGGAGRLTRREQTRLDSAIIAAMRQRHDRSVVFTLREGHPGTRISPRLRFILGAVRVSRN